MSNFYDEKVEVLTRDGFKYMKDLEDDELILLNSKTNKLEVVKDYVRVKDRQMLSNFGVNRRSIIGTNGVENKLFYSLDFKFTEDLNDPIEVDIDDKVYKLDLYSYLLLGYMLFNYFSCTNGNKRFEFRPPISDTEKVICEFIKILGVVPLDLQKQLDKYSSYGDTFYLTTNSFPNGEDTYIRVVVDCLLKNKNVLRPFIDTDIIYDYGDTDDNSYYYLNLKNPALEKIFCMIFNLYFGAAVLKKKTGWDTLFSTNIFCPKDCKRDIQRFSVGTGIKNCYSIKVENENYYIPSNLSMNTVTNFSFIPVYSKNV